MHQVWKTICETGDHVNQRMNGQRADWKHKRFASSPVAEHFCSPELDFLNHVSLCCLDHNPLWTSNLESSRELLDPTSEHSMAISTKATTRGNHRTLVRACDSLCRTLFSCDFLKSKRKLGLFALNIGEKRSVLLCCLWRIVFNPF